MATKIKRIFQKGSLFNITNETTGQPVTEASLVSIGDILDILTMDADKVPHIYGGCAEVISVSGFNTKIKVKDETNFIIGYKDKNKPLPYLKITNNANVDLYKADGTKITDTTELYVNDVIKVKPKDLNYFAGADVEALDDNSYITWVNPPEDDSSEECTFRANVQEITLIEKEVERLQRFIVSSDFADKADIHCVHLRYNKEIPVGTIYTMLCKGDRFQLTFKDGFYVDMSDADKGFELEDAENHIYKATRIGRVYIDIKFKGKNVTLKIPNTTKCKVIKIDSEEVIPNDTVMKTGDKFRVIMTDARYYLKIPDNTTMNESGPWKYDELDGQRYFVCQIKNVPIDTVTIPDMPEKPTLNLDMRESVDRDKIKSVTSIYGPTTSTLPSNIFHAGEPFKIELKDEYKNDYIITAKNERGVTIPSDDSTNFKIDLRYDPQIVLKLESNTTKVKITNVRDGSDLVNGSILKRGDKFTVEFPTFKKYINITFSDSIGVYHTYSSTKVTYIVKNDATKAEIKIEEAPIAHFNNKAHDLIKIFAMERTPQVEITTFPDDILHVGEQFRIVWKNPSDFIKYEIVYTNIEKTGEVAYKPTAVGAVLDTIPMLHFTVVGYWSDIEFFNETTGKAISNMEQVHKGDIIKITLPHKYGTVTPNEDLEVLSDTELVKRYKIKDISSATPTVTLEETPKARINNLSPEILYVKAIDRTPAELITTFPEDILYVGENIEIGFKDSADESKYIIKPTTHLELVEGKKYKIKSAGGGVEAKKKAILHIIKSSATSTEEECTVINYYDTSINYHDGDTVYYGDNLRINLNETGYELDSDKIKDLQENSGNFIVNGDNPTIATKLKAGNLHIDQQGRELCHVYKEDQVTELHESDSIYKGDIIYVVRTKEQYKISSTSGLEEQPGSAGLSHKFKITDVQNTYVSLNDEGYTTIDSDHPELIHVIDVMTNEVLTLPDSTTYKNNEDWHRIFKIQLKHGLNPSDYPITIDGAEDDYEGYRITSFDKVMIHVETPKPTLHILKSTPSATEAECTVFNPKDSTIHYEEGTKLELNTQICIYVEDGFLLDTDRLVDLEFVENVGDTTIYKITGFSPTVATKEAPAVTVNNENPDKIEIQTTKYPQVTLSTYPDTTHIKLNSQITMFIKDGFTTTHKIEFTGLKDYHYNRRYKVEAMTVNVKAVPKKPQVHIKLSGDLASTLVYNEATDRTIHDNDLVQEGDVILLRFRNNFVKVTEISGLDLVSKNRYIVREDATEVKITLAEAPKAHLDNLSQGIITAYAMEAQLPDDIYDYPENILHIGEKFKVRFINHTNIGKYDIEVTNAERIEDEDAYKITAVNPTIKAVPKPKPIIFKVSGDAVPLDVFDETSNVAVSDGDTIHTKDVIRITLPHRFITVTPSSGLERISDSNPLIRKYKVKADAEGTEVSVEAKYFNKAHLNNLNKDLIYISTLERGTDNFDNFTDFPEDKLFVDEKILIKFKNDESANSYQLEFKNLEKTDEHQYKITAENPEVKAVAAPKVHVTVNATCGIDEHEIDIYKSTLPSETPIDFSTNPAFDLGTKLYVKLNKYVKIDMDNSEGIEFVKEEDGFDVYKLINTNAIFTTTLKDDVFEISITISTPGSAEVFRENETDTLESSDYIAKDEIVVVKVNDSKYVLTVDGLSQISHEGNTYKYKVTDSPTILIEDHTPIIINSNHPELIKVTDEYGVTELTLPDSTTYNFSSLSHAIQVYLKEGLNLSYYTISVTGANEYGPNQYRFNEPLEENVLINVEVAKATLTIVSHETPSEIKVTNIAGDTEYHNGNQIEVGAKIKIITNSPYVVDKDQLVDIEAVDEANSIYKITGLNPKVEAVVKTTPSTFHIKGDKDGVTVKKHPSQQEVHDGDVLTVGEKLSIVKVNGFKLTDLEGIVSTDPVNNIYTVTGTESSVTCTLNPTVTINNTTPDRIEIKNHLGVSLTAYPDSTTLHQGEDITIEFKPPYNDTDYEIKFSGLEHKSGSNYQVKEDATEVKVYVSWKSIQLTITGKSSAVNVQSNGNLISNDYIFTAGDKFVVTRSNTFVTYTVTGADKFTSAEDTELKQTYIVREDATSVVINVEEAHCVMIDNENPDIVAVKTVDPPIVTLTTYPNSDTIHDNQDFLVEWINPSYLNDYKLSVIAANHKSEMMYTALSSPIIIKANHKAKIHILDKEHTNVTNMSNEPIYDNDYSLAIGDKLKIQRPPYSYEYRVKSVTGAVQKLGYLYEITDENVTIEIEPVPLVTINNDNPDIISVSYYWNSVRNNIDTFPCSDKIHQTQEIVIEYRDEDLYKPLYDINVTGATATPSEHRYRVGTTDVNISAVMKVVPSHIKIKHAANITVTAESDGRELHDGDTSISTTEVIKIVPKKFFKINPALLKGLKATSDPNKFTIVAKEVEVDVEEEPTVTLYNNKDSLLRILVQDNEVTTFPSNLLHNEEIFKVLFRVTSLKDKYDMKVTGAELQASIPDGYSYKVSGPVVTIDCEHKKIPATIHIPDEVHVEVKTIENVVIHDGDTSLFIGDKIKIIPKPGYKIKESLAGLLKEGKEYKLIDADVTIEVEPRPYVTINNEAEALVKVSTSAEPLVEIVTFPSTADIREGETFQVEFRNATDENKYNIIVDGAMKLSDKRYQAVSSPITIKTKDRPKVDPYLIKLRRSQGFGVRYIKWSRKGKLVHENSFF